MLWKSLFSKGTRIRRQGARCSLLIVKWCPNLCIDHLQKTGDSFIRPIKKPKTTMLTKDPEEEDAMFLSRFLCDVFLSSHGANTPPATASWITSTTSTCSAACRGSGSMKKASSEGRR
ncbi:hypothetical protein ACJRO7_026630 [Eucalyptus globulus]|uniref:Uncharacterized protein n=1 Tax=Eucalyptus globulus TaxID=34317 RepID=A0ABD3JTE3_EUCGL